MASPIEYQGKPMTFDPTNISVLRVVQLLYRGTPQVVILEPGDATRYVLLLVPLGTGIAPYLGDYGILSRESNQYLFVSKLAGEECLGTWIPFGQDRVVRTHNVVPLSNNEWSRQFLAWWFTSLYEYL
ncbi:hypothetical protein LCGC14_0251920 [marine sediment metagenome]|uniref:Uncharacterized protein n=1 Tax=marine sediment metagenome TaxID=412755 RepID=A0A0F9U4F6_9ZZZZ